MSKLEWKPNEKQVAFMEVLAKNPNGLTLAEIEVLTGVKYATGTINTLIAKEKVVCEPIDVECEVVAEVLGEKRVVGKTTKHWNRYRLNN